MNSRIATSPPRINQTTSDIPSSDGAPSAGRIQPQSEENSTPMIADTHRRGPEHRAQQIEVCSFRDRGIGDAA